MTAAVASHFDTVLIGNTDQGIDLPVAGLFLILAISLSAPLMACMILNAISWVKAILLM